MHALSKPKILNIKSILSESWALLRGSKWPIWLTIFPIVIVINLFTYIVKHYGLLHPDFTLHGLRYFACLLFIFILNAPLSVGATLIGVKRARGETISAGSGYHYFRFWIPLAIAEFFVFLILQVFSGFGFYIGDPKATLFITIFTLCITPLLLLTYPLIVDKNMNAFSAIYQSIMMTAKNWWRILVIFFLISFFSTLVLALTFSLFVLILLHLPVYFGVPMNMMLIHAITISIFFISIWLVPYWVIVTGVIYQELVGDEAGVISVSDQCQ